MSYFAERYKSDVDFREKAKKRGRDAYHGVLVLRTDWKHGMRNTGAWRSWAYMKSRVLSVTNKDHRYYENITMEPRWKEFMEFYKDMGNRPEGMTLDRKDNNKGYYPDNCQWATRAQQARNKNNNAIKEKDVPEIMGLAEIGLNDSEIGILVGCSNSVVYNVRHGRSWKGVANV